MPRDVSRETASIVTEVLQIFGVTSMRRPHSFRKRLLALTAAAALAPAACGGGGDYQLVDAPSAFELAQDSSQEVVVLDIRTPEEFSAGHIEGSVMIDFYSPDFRTQLDGLDKDVAYLVYCRSGNRSSQAMPVFRDLGFKTVSELEGGIITWAEAGLPLTAS
jgi:rhodanese-related sulfurtransferase